MGYIKEPDGIDFVVDSKPLTQASRKKISEVIAYYKATGRKMAVKKILKRTTSSLKIKKSV
jgi:hypothetical protein